VWRHARRSRQLGLRANRLVLCFRKVEKFLQHTLRAFEFGSDTAAYNYNKACYKSPIKQAKQTTPPLLVDLRRCCRS
jgi:hypothetical protein